MGVKVRIMLPYDPTGKFGVKKVIPDTVIINDPKPEEKEVEKRTQPQ